MHWVVFCVSETGLSPKRLHRQTPDGLEWYLQRNCALSPRQLGFAFGAIGLVSGLIATVFATQGAWVIAPFAGIEMLALAIAFVVYARHTGDFERIVLQPDRLLVEVVDGRRRARFEANPAWVRVEMGRSAYAAVRISERGGGVEVGRLLAFEERVEFARDLAQNLRVVPVAMAARDNDAGMQGEV